jgi:hypothetical protein
MVTIYRYRINTFVFDGGFNELLIVYKHNGMSSTKLVIKCVFHQQTPLLDATQVTRATDTTGR